MRFGKLFWKLFVGNMALLVIALGTSLWLIAGEVNDVQDRELSGRLAAQAGALSEVVRDDFSLQHAARLDTLIKRIGRTQPLDTRITLILADGTVLAETELDAGRMEPHADRPEVVQALQGGIGQDTRKSRTLAKMMRYVAVSVPKEGGGALGVVRVAMPVRTISEEEGSMRRLIWGIGLLILAAGLLLAMGLAQLWSLPIRRITMAARSLSRGDLDTRIKVSGSDELDALSRSLNEMRGRLAAHLETIDLQRRTLELLLTQLHEGVVVAGPNGRVVLMNPAAARMLDVALKPGEALSRLPGQSIEECIPQHELQQLLLPRATAPSGANGRECEEAVRELRLRARETGEELAILARASDIALPDPASASAPHEPAASTQPGRLLVLSDVTPLTRLLQVKADFAANASHELRTPLSAIRASIETLLHIDFAEETDSARHFVAVIDRHSRRLEMLVADLLELSRLESARTPFRPTDVALREILGEVAEQHTEAVTAKQLSLRVELPERLNRILGNDHLIRVILDNLVDNAIKFTEPGGHILVSGDLVDSASGRSVILTVTDDGCGIAPDEQPRVFERFYQVERARSGGVMRGTGLGLSIVRHAVAAMKGTVELASELGKGTRVTLTIPQPSEKPSVTTAMYRD